MGVPSLPCSLGGVHWQSGARRLLPSGVLGGAQPQGTPPRTPPPGETRTERLDSTFHAHPVLASGAGASPLGGLRRGTDSGQLSVGRALPKWHVSEGKWGASRSGGACALFAGTKENSVTSCSDVSASFAQTQNSPARMAVPREGRASLGPGKPPTSCQLSL